MAEPFLSEIRIFSFDFPPKGWAFCSGQLLLINQNQALFSLLGTTYGGNGQTTFALPNMGDRVPIHTGNGFVLGQVGGEEAHTVTSSELPAHNHFVSGTQTDGDSTNPTGAILARSPNNFYGQPTNLTTLNSQSVTNIGGSQPHHNMQPYLVLNFSIALQGIYPSQT